jgi:3-methyladenine DNA glycosylase/8-oxoguanine DNA glycosylase
MALAKSASLSTPVPAHREVEIETPSDFDFAWALGFLASRVAPALEAASPDLYVRSVWLDAFSANGDAPGAEGAQRTEGALRIGPTRRAAMDASAAAATVPVGPVTLAIQPCVTRGATGVGLRVAAAPAIPAALLRRAIVALFDLDVDLDGFTAHMRRDPIMKRLVARQRRLRLPQLLDPFEGMVRAVIGQQVSVRAASTMIHRLVEAFGRPSPALDAGFASATMLRAFPRPADMADAGVDAIRAIGLTRAKTASLHAIAVAVASGAIDGVKLRQAAADDAQAALVALPGIGPWTASYIRMRALGDRDAFPAKDLGVIKALDALGVARARHEAVAERWRPWRAYATLHLWESLSA